MYIRKKVRLNRKRRPRFRRRKYRKNVAKGHSRKITDSGNVIFRDSTRVGPLPNKYFGGLTYYDNALTINPGVGSYATYVYQLNGAYDPNITGTGHQPNGFDQMMSLYHYYNVIGAKATITIRNKDTTYSMYIGAFVHQTSSPTLTGSEPMENGNGSFELLQPSPLDGSKGSLTVNWSAKKWFGTKRLIGEDSYQALKTANPDNPAYLIIWAYGRNAEDIQFAELDVRIDMAVVYTNPEYLTAS